MDSSILIIIAVAFAVVIAIIIFLLVGKDKDDDGQVDAPTFKVGKAKVDTSVPNTESDKVKSALNNSADMDDIDKNMQTEETEILTKYTAGSGAGVAEVEKLLEGDPNNVDLLDWLAFMYYSNGDIDRAIETYKKVLSIKSDNENQHYYLGNSYYKKEMYAEAKKCWSEVIRLKPSSKIAKNAQERIEYLNSKGK